MIIDNTNNSIFEKLFNENKLNIPRYQRDYAWDQENMDEILETIFDKTNWEMYFSNPKEQYFIGTLITYQDKNITNIIDGQQRTITFYLIFLTAHKILTKLIEDNELLKIKFEELKENYVDYNDFYFKLIALTQSFKNLVNNSQFTLKEDDEKILQKIKNQDVIIGSHANNKVYQNYEYLHNKLQANFNSNLLEFLKAVTFAKEKIVFIQVNLHSYEEAIEIFVSLNSNRKPLEIHELLNSLFIKDTNVLEEHKTANRFDQLLKEINKEIISDFISSVWFIKLGKKIPKNDIYKEMTKYLKTHKQKSLVILDELESMKNSYLLSTNIKKFDLLKHSEDNNMIDNIINTFKDSKMTQVVPLIMKSIKHYEDNVINDKEFKEIIIQLFDVSVYANFISNVKSQNFEAFTKKVAQNNKLTPNILKNDISNFYREIIKQSQNMFTTSIKLGKSSNSALMFIKWKEFVINGIIPEAKLNSTTLIKIVEEVDVNINSKFMENDYLLISGYIYNFEKKVKLTSQTYEEKIIELAKHGITVPTSIEELRIENKLIVNKLCTYISKYLPQENEGNKNL